MKRKILKESVIRTKGQAEWDLLVEAARRNYFFRRFAEEMRKKLKETEGTLQGAVSTETDATGALGEVYAQILMGIEKYHPLDFARIFHTDKVSLAVPVGTYGAVGERGTDGTFSSGEKTTSNVTITLDKEYGGDFSWTKAYLEDAVWDTLSEQNEAAGYEMQHKLCERLLRELQGIDQDDSAGGAVVSIASQSAITWQEFLSVCAAVDVAGTGMADYVLVSPKRYWQLMALDQFVNSLYAGDDATVRSGVLKTTLGTTVIKISDLGEDKTASAGDVTQNKYKTLAGGDFTVGKWVKGTTGSGIYKILADSKVTGAGTTGLLTLEYVSGTPWVDAETLTEYNEVGCSTASGVTAVADGTHGAWIDIMALNSKKAIALVYRRMPEIEPYSYPDENRYGFTLSCRAKVGAVVPSAVALGLAAA